MTKSPKRQKSPKPQRPSSPKRTKRIGAEAAAPHTYTNSKGVEYTLYSTMGKNNNTLIFYSPSSSQPKTGKPSTLPDGYITKEAKSCMPHIAKA